MATLYAQALDIAFETGRDGVLIRYMGPAEAKRIRCTRLSRLRRDRPISRTRTSAAQSCRHRNPKKSNCIAMRSGARRAVGALHVVHGYPSVGVIYNIVHAARRDGRAVGELAFKPRPGVRTSRSDLRGPIHANGRRTAHGDRLVVWGVPGHQNRSSRCRLEGLKGSQFSSRVRK